MKQGASSDSTGILGSFLSDTILSLRRSGEAEDATYGARGEFRGVRKDAVWVKEVYTGTDLLELKEKIDRLVMRLYKANR